MKCPQCGYLVPVGIGTCPRCRFVLAQPRAGSAADPVQVEWLSHGSRTRRLPLLIGASALIVLGVVVLIAVRLTSGTETAPPNAPVPIPTGVTTSSPGATPTSTPSTDPTPSTPPPPTSSSPAPELKFQRVVFSHFSVDLRDAKVTGADGLLIRARVCVRKLPPDPQGNKTRISWDPWRVVTRDGTSHKPELFDGSHPPSKLFPPDRTYRVDSCATGWIPFADVTSLDDVRSISYRNGLGESTEWRRS